MNERMEDLDIGFAAVVFSASTNSIDVRANLKRERAIGLIANLS